MTAVMVVKDVVAATAALSSYSFCCYNAFVAEMAVAESTVAH